MAGTATQGLEALLNAIKETVEDGMTEDELKSVAGAIYAALLDQGFGIGALTDDVKEQWEVMRYLMYADDGPAN